MKQKRRISYLFIIIAAFLGFSISVKAETVTPNNGEQQIIDYSIGLFDWESIERTEEALVDALPQGVHFDLREEMEKIISGEKKITVATVGETLMKMLLQEVGTFIQFGGRFILIVLLCNLLEALGSSFKSKNTVKIGFFVCYMAILLSVVQSFQIMTQLALRVIDDLNQLMMVCVPTLLAFMATTGFAVSAGSMAPVIISTLTLLTYVIKVIILPCIISVVVLEVLSTMSQEVKVDKLVALFYKGIKWALRTMLALSVGLLGMYRLLMPGVDMTVKKAAVRFSSAFIPVVGGAVGGMIDFITQGASLVRNTFSAGVILWVLLILSVPLIKILAYICIYQVAGAVIEPLGDKKMASIATKLGKGSQFIMSCVGMVALFSICCLIICMTISSAGL